MTDLYDKDSNLYDIEAEEADEWDNTKSRVIGAIRRLFRQSPQFKKVWSGSRVEVTRYNKDGTLSKKPYVKKTCEVCGELFSTTNIAIDHIEPVVPLHLTNEDLTYDEIVSRLICPSTNLQRICNPKRGSKNKPQFLQFCHQKKTHLESFIRTKWKNRFKELGITTRNEKDSAYNLSKHLEDVWRGEYLSEVSEKIKQRQEKETKKAKRNKK